MDRHSMVILAALLVVGCGGGGDDGPAGAGGQGGASGSGGTAGTGGGSGLCGQTPAPNSINDVTGTWGMLEVAARLAQAPTIPDPLPNSAVTLYLLSQEQNGTAVNVQGEACQHWVSDPESDVHTLIPDAYIVALDPLSLAGTYEVDEDGVGTYRLPEPFVQVFGADLGDPATDPLPTEPTDPGVIDEDQDGSPGVTVVLSGIVPGELHVVSRRVSTLEAQATASDRLAGVLDFEAEEKILESIPAEIKALGPTVVADPAPCKSTVEMVRLPDGTDCADLIAQYETLFPDAVPQP